MTEAEWLAGTNPEKMLEFVLAEEPIWPLRLLRLFAKSRKPPSSRKLRLFLSAFLRQDPSSFPDTANQQALLVAEQWADGQASSEDLRQAIAHASAIWNSDPETFGAAPPASLVLLVQSTGVLPSRRDLEMVFHLFAGVPESGLHGVQGSRLIRHIFGNPFRAYLPRDSLPATVLDLARTLYTGHDCAPILADALEEAGHAELAEHMRSEAIHPKGCWVLDLILGKS
jgi:hypothetical protein